MTLLAVTWIVVMPWAFAALMSSSPRLRSVVARHYPSTMTAGWLGVALLVGGAIALTGAQQEAALAVGAPLAGLSIWGHPYCPKPPSHE